LAPNHLFVDGLSAGMPIQLTEDLRACDLMPGDPASRLEKALDQNPKILQ
jgi:hypothetical protein